MSRGGRREGAGSKPKWIHGKTKVIRVPEALADRVLELAQLLDEGVAIEDVTKSKRLDLSGVKVVSVGSRSAVFLADLIRSGFRITPFELTDRIYREMDRRG